jgi:hypothetical protein
MADDKIDETIEYYNVKINEIIKRINSSNNLTAEQIIYNGEQLAILEYKLTALEVAKEN